MTGLGSRCRPPSLPAPGRAARLILLPAVVAVVAMACAEPTSPPFTKYDARRPRRLIEPPHSQMRAVPPHAIHSRGVGPYVLGMPLQDVLGQLARGPRVTLTRLDGVVDYHLVRAENGALIIGVEPPSGITFVSVLDAETARTESGVGVGTGIDELRKALGAELASPRLALDPGLMGFAEFPNTRFLLAAGGERVAAVLVRQEQGPSRAGNIDVAKPEQVSRKTAPKAAQKVSRKTAKTAAGSAARAVSGDGAATSSCPSSEVLTARGRQIEKLLGSSSGDSQAGSRRILHHQCFTGTTAETLVVGVEDVVLVGGTSDKLRRLAVQPIPGLVYAAPIDVNGDGRSEIAAVRQSDQDDERVMSLLVLRFDSGRLGTLVEREVYRVSAAKAAWIGARLDEIELLIEIQAISMPASIQVGGLYVQQRSGRIETVAPLLPVVLSLDQTDSMAPGRVAVPDARSASPGGLDAAAAPSSDAGALPPNP